jgi:hypothetical protein
MIIGWYLDRCEQHAQHKDKWFIWRNLITVLSVILVVCLSIGVKAMPAIETGAIELSLVLLAVAIVTWYFLWHKQVLKAVWGQAACMALVSLVIVTSVLPPITATLSMRTTGQSFIANYDGKSPVYVQKFLHPGFTFYTGIYGKEINSPEEIKKIIDEPGKAYFVIKESQYSELSSTDKGRTAILAESGNKLILTKQ